ncbi:hypothetical protein ACFSC1_09265 [Paracoccus aurantiacus]|nr:hypothetical protein [Paracoccus aurantiacus]
MRLLKILVVLLVLGFLALAGYAYLGDMAPRQTEMRQPVALDTGADGAGAAAPVAAPAATPEAVGGTDEDGASTAAETGTAEQTDANGLD